MAVINPLLPREAEKGGHGAKGLSSWNVTDEEFAQQEGREGVLDSGDAQKQGRDIQTGSRCGVPHVGELLTSIYEDLLCAGNNPTPSSLLGETLALFADEDREDTGS